MQGPINPATRTRSNEAIEIKDDLNALWGKGWIKGYAVVFGLLGTMYLINHAFDWVGMIANTFIFMVYSIILAPVLTAPSLTGAVTIAGLFGRDVPQAFKTYLGGIAPNIAFWSLLAVGAMAWLPWHLGALWAGPLVMAISLFLVVHTWKYASEAKIIKTLSLWYAIGVLLVGLGFALGLNKPAENLYNWANPPSTFNVETGAVQRVMNGRTGEVHETISPADCAARAHGVCYDGETGEVLVPYDAAKVAAVTQKPRTVAPTKPAPEPTKRILSSADYLSRQTGVFPQVTLDSTGIVVSDYQDSDLVYAISGGMGKLAVQYRGALTGPWTDATLVNGTEIKLNPGDNAWQYRFYTTRGTLKFDLERAEVPS